MAVPCRPSGHRLERTVWRSRRTCSSCGATGADRPFVRGAMSPTPTDQPVHDHALVTGSTALSLPSSVVSHTPGLGTTWYTDHSVVSTLLGASRWRSSTTSTAADAALLHLEVVRHTGCSPGSAPTSPAGRSTTVTTASTSCRHHGDIENWLAVRGARVQWCTTGRTPSTGGLPVRRPVGVAAVRCQPHLDRLRAGLAAHASGAGLRGRYVGARQRRHHHLDTVYDSTLLAQNKTTHSSPSRASLLRRPVRQPGLHRRRDPGWPDPDGAASYALTRRRRRRPPRSARSRPTRNRDRPDRSQGGPGRPTTGRRTTRWQPYATDRAGLRRSACGRQHPYGLSRANGPFPCRTTALWAACSTWRALRQAHLIAAASCSNPTVTLSPFTL